MNYGERWRVIAVSAFVFTVFIAALTALRVWDLEPATSVQSAIVNGTALLVVASVTYYEYQGADFIGGWILALGPSLAFTLNLFIPVSTTGISLKIISALVSAAAISGVITMIGYAVGQGLSKLRETEGITDPS